MWECLDAFYIGDQLYNLPGWADETVDCAVRWNRVNRHFNVIDFTGVNLWNRHRLECSFNQSAFRIRPSRCINEEYELQCYYSTFYWHNEKEPGETWWHFVQCIFAAIRDLLKNLWRQDGRTLRQSWKLTWLTLNNSGRPKTVVHFTK